MKPRYLVSDEIGPLRIFDSKEEAQAFMDSEMTMKTVPGKPKPDPFKIVGDAPF
jgi:hypothetical protein